MELSGRAPGFQFPVLQETSTFSQKPTLAIWQLLTPGTSSHRPAHSRAHHGSSRSPHLRLLLVVSSCHPRQLLEPQLSSACHHAPPHRLPPVTWTGTMSSVFLHSHTKHPSCLELRTMNPKPSKELCCVGLEWTAVEKGGGMWAQGKPMHRSLHWATTGPYLEATTKGSPRSAVVP